MDRFCKTPGSTTNSLATRLREYQYKFLHKKPGRFNVNADALSRNPPLEEAIAFPTSASAKFQGNPRQATSSGRGRLGSKTKTALPDLSESGTPGLTIARRVRARHKQVEPPKIQKPPIKQLTKKSTPLEPSTSKQPLIKQLTKTLIPSEPSISK